MTCASCVARVEKKLGKIPGVHATVNLATESARVQVPAEVSDEDVINQVVRAGYGAELVLPEPEHPSAGAGEVEADTELPADTRAASLRRRFLICAALSLPVMALSMVPAWQFTGWQWVVAALALPVAGWGAWPFHRAAAQAARHGSSTMDTLVSLGVLAATGWSVWALLWGGAGKLGMTMDMTLLPRLSGSGGHAGHHSVPELYFESAAMVTTFLLAGRWAETRARHRAGAALRDLLELGAKEATRVRERGGVVVEESIPAAQVRPGDLLRIRPGEKMPADGAVVEGASAVDTSMITGEMEPVEVGAGDPVTAGTIALTGSVLMRAERVGADTVVAQIGRMVTQAQAEKAPIQRLADRISAVFVPIVVALAGATFIGWWLLDGRLMAAFTAAVAVLVIACPCALGLATPTALLVGSGRAAKLGVLIKSPQILEAARSIDTIIWDKTGTLTSGQVQVTGVLPHAPGVTEAEVLRLAAAVEQLSEHPLARAIVAATGSGETLPTASEFVTSAGLGVSATVAGQRVVVGKADYLAAARIEVPGASGTAGLHVPADATVVWVARAGTCLGAICLAAPLRATARSAVVELNDMGVESVLLTGDRTEAAHAVAQQLEITRVFAEVMPADKRDTVAALQAEGRVTAMVGDGINDAAALAQAGVQGLGMAMGSGTDLAIAAADITLMRSDPRAAAVAVRIARATLRTIKQNLFWAFCYNVAAIPLAMAGLLNPMIAGAAMAFSSVFVVLNSLRLRKRGEVCPPGRAAGTVESAYE